MWPDVARTLQRPFELHSQHIRPELPDHFEIGARAIGPGKEFAFRIRRERAVRDAFDVKFLFAKAKKFSVHTHPLHDIGRFHPHKSLGQTDERFKLVIGGVG
jgi:hypothetical protein